jgi:hypothetical protein
MPVLSRDVTRWPARYPSLMRPSHRLDLLFVPTDPEAAPQDAALELLAQWTREALLDEQGFAEAPAANAFGTRFLRAWVDAGPIRLYANRQGGFRVACGHCAASVVPAFNDAMRTLRAGGPRNMTCPSCGQTQALETLRYAPKAAFGRLALVLSDVTSTQISDRAHAQIEDAIGIFHVVASRMP